MKPQYEDFLAELNELQAKYDLAIDWQPSGIELRERGQADESEPIGMIINASPTFVGKFKTDELTYL